MSVLLTARDIAGFLLKADFSFSDENAVIVNIWTHDKALIPDQYRNDLQQFKHDIRRMMGVFQDSPEEREAFESIMNEMECDIQLPDESEDDTNVDLFLKRVRMELMFIIGIKIKRIKLKRFLAINRCRRRSEKFVTKIRSALMDLDLVTCGKGGILCDIADFKLEDMMTIRLREYT